MEAKKIKYGRIVRATVLTCPCLLLREGKEGTGSILFACAYEPQQTDSIAEAQTYLENYAKKLNIQTWS